MSDVSEHAGLDKYNADPRVNRFNRNYALKRKFKLTEEFGQVIWDKNYPYICKTEHSQDQRNSRSKSENSCKSSCDSISSIGSNKGLQWLDSKHLNPKSTIEDLNLMSPSYKRKESLDKTEEDEKILAKTQRDPTQVLYYDIQTGKDYTK